ncbi:hypothetical protein LTR12_004555 [Friedmanniomyces endolithicus]|nr:hypothetical protein LTR74_004833 [Friedmanniomyces endolithicus]KAK1821002.1 hypothetical protein LTR12_004555 [Friedmanniomyces endolithicus]
MDSGSVPRGVFVLPNEINSLVQRILHQRLQIAASLAGHTLYLECHHPSARLVASKFFCTSLGTDGLPELLARFNGQESSVEPVKKAGSLYTSFRPQRTEPDVRTAVTLLPGDIPGSRTFQTAVAAVNSIAGLSAEEIVTESVTVDAHDLFSQLTTQAYLGKRESTRGFLFSIQEVSEGTIRVWRDWLARQCESKKWTDGDTVIVHHETPVVPVIDKGKGRSDSVTGYEDPTKDPRILWVNTRDDNVGIRFRVLERTWKRDRPLLYSSDVEVAVSYQVEFEEVLVRTTHLLLKLEEAEQQMANHSGKAIVFGSYAGLQEFDTSGHPRR